MTRILAIDPSLTSAGFCWGEKSLARCAPKSRGAERLDAHRHFMRLRMGTADMIVVEGMPAHAPSQRGVMDRAELYGVLRMTAYDAGIPFREVNIAHIKMFATGKGNANKDAMLAAAIRRFGYDGTSNDEADALILWHLCKRALGEGLVSLPQAHERCLDAVREVLA